MSRHPQFHLLLHSADLLEDHLRRELSPLGVRPRQARVLNALDRMGQASQSRLATEFGISRASMSTMTARLIARGFITRTEDPADPRGNILALSDTGRALLSDIETAWDRVDAIITETIGAQNARRLAELTYDLRNGLGGRAPGTDATLDRPKGRR